MFNNNISYNNNIYIIIYHRKNQEKFNFLFLLILILKKYNKLNLRVEIDDGRFYGFS